MVPIVLSHLAIMFLLLVWGSVRILRGKDQGPQYGAAVMWFVMTVTTAIVGRVAELWP